MRRIPNETVLTYRTSNRYPDVWTVRVTALVAVDKGADYYIVIATHRRGVPLTNPRFKYPRAAFLERQCPHHVKTWDPKMKRYL